MGADTPEPSLDPEERRALLRGVEQFNGGYFFECHETLEDLWSGVRGPSRSFFQGLIQVAVAFHHLGNGNHGGATSMLRRALQRFEGYPGRYFGFDLDAHRRELQSWLERVEGGELGAVSLDELPKWRLEQTR
jgi:predicted metal-dependent hydrolase